MQIINDVRRRAQHLLEDNASTILTAGGVVGTVTTAVLSGRAGYKFAQLVTTENAERLVRYEDHNDDGDGDILLTKTDKIRLGIVYFVPPVMTGGVTIASIVMANRMSAQKAAALAAAYGLSQRQLEEYKHKVAEKLGATKTQKLEDELAQDRVNNTPGSNQIVIIEGEVLCFDEPTGRYFRSTMEQINQAVNAINTAILHQDHASASQFYEELGLPATTWTDEVGWNTDQLVELKFSTVMSPDNKPCIAIDFKYLPKVNYIQRHYD